MLLALALVGAAAHVTGESGEIGRSTEQRAIDVAYRLATAGRKRCAVVGPISGIQWQVLGQFAPRDRPAAIRSFHLDRGPRVIAVAAPSPAARAGLNVGDVLLSVDGRALHNHADLTTPVDQRASLASMDAIESWLESASPQPTKITVSRNGAEHTLSFSSPTGCPLHLYVARSNEQNAYADGLHLLVPDGLIDRIGEDNQLALLIAHEMAHNILGHAAQLRSAPQSDRRALVRRQEDDADALGVDLALDAGYDVIRGSRVFLLRRDFGLLRSHRSGEERVKMALARVRQRDATNPAPP